MGAYHSCKSTMKERIRIPDPDHETAELPLLFGTHFEYNGQSTFYEYEVSHFMEALWLSFASDPTAGPKIANGFTWPQFNASADTMVQFANGTTKVQLVSGSIIDGNCSGIVTSLRGAAPAK